MGTYPKLVVWTDAAQQSRLSLLRYWKHRNGTPTYSEKLQRQFKTTEKKIEKDPLIGRATTYGNVRVITAMKTYDIFYVEKESTIDILFIWDRRRDPEDLDKRLRAFRKL
jgi:plasmid stabilization system protein ParE